MAREARAWTPVWDGSIEGWTKNFIREHIWRCDSIHTFDDLMQDARLTFLRVKTTYPRVVEAKHFMSLYKTAMSNEMADKARARWKRDAEVPMDDDTRLVVERLVGEWSNDGYLKALINELPEELKLVLAAFDDPDKREAMRVKPKRTKLQVKAGIALSEDDWTAQICRLAGIPRTDLLGRFKAALGG